MSKKALGRGLDALFTGSPSLDNDLVELYVDQIDPGRSQPRHVFKDDKLQELAASIKANGLIQPVVVRRAGERFQLIAGERRWRASQIAGLHKIPCVVKEATDENVLALSLIENLQREDLNPIEEAFAYKSLQDHFNATQDQIAKRIGKDRSSIANSLRLLRLPTEVQGMIEQDQLSAGHAKALLAASSGEIQKALAAEIVEKGLSVREAERLLQKSERSLRASARRAALTDANVVAAEAKLKKRLGSPVKIKFASRGRAGQIEIKFSSMEDLMRIYDLVMKKV